MAEKRRKSLAVTVIFWLVVAGALAGGLIYYFTREPVVEVTAVRVTRGAIEQTISAISSGVVTPGMQSRVSAAALGVVAAVHVEEGDRVEAGALLVELEHAELDAQVALAEANLEVGRSRLEQVRIAARINDEISSAQLAQARAQLEAAKADFDRIKSLADRKAVSQSDFDKIALAYRVSQETVAAAEAGRKEVLVRQEEIRAAETGIRQLEAAVRAAQVMREKAFVRAPFAGVVAKKLLHVGEAVAMGLPVVMLVQEQDRYITAPFDEANYGAMFVGQKARITLDAYPDREFEGELSYIAPVVTMVQDLTRTLDVKVRILTEPEKFVPGMSADVTLIADEKDDAVFAPSESLIRDEFAYVIENGRAVRRDVTVGIGNWERREILEGLREGEHLITSVNLKALRDGAPVNIVDELDF
ncbi:MAG TPA: efflux RND transporter periplasmic adaptor subunit [Candidatus Hydrogenedentes bacterium]|nr:efflux RND transporter periplasmic adaptor subunit [Candidatus Hydrogenedentota bacterium]